MKSRTYIALFCCFFCAAGFLLAEDAEEAITEQPEDLIRASKETRILHRLLEMDDEELAQLRQTIDRIEKMSPEEKDELRNRIGAIHRMSPGKVDRLREKFKAIPKEQREAMRTRWMEMGPEEHAELHSRLKSMTAEERMALLKEKGFLLPPLPEQHQEPLPKEEH